MGAACAGDRSEEDIRNAKRAKLIEDQLKRERKQGETRVKLLLLGTGDSGKSTFVKQMKIIHKNGFSVQEIAKFQVVLQENCLQSMQKIISCEQVSIPSDLQTQKERVLDSNDLHLCVDEIVALWECTAVKNAFENRSELAVQVPSTTPYFFANARRFAGENFQPSAEDMFRAKQKTTGISEVIFEVNRIQFTIVDVGGQRSERRKWLHCFDDVTSVIYLAALDEYDMKLEEDNQTNRLDESLRLFGEVTGSAFFKPTSWILFLNKSDLFKEKISVKPLNLVFSDFKEDPNDFVKSHQYIENKYQSTFKGQRLYCHVTCAIDTDNCRKVFSAVRDTVITSALNEAGF